MKAWEAGEILGDERLKTYMMQIMREAGWEGACGRLSSPATVARVSGKAGGTGTSLWSSWRSSRKLGEYPAVE